MSKTNFEVNHRYLVNFKDTFVNNLTEVKVLEISKKKNIKLSILRSDGESYIDWKNVSEFEIIEDLGLVSDLSD